MKYILAQLRCRLYSGLSHLKNYFNIGAIVEKSRIMDIEAKATDVI